MEIQKKRLWISQIIILISVVAILLSLFLPYMKATEEYEDRLDLLEALAAEDGIDTDAMKSMSIAEWVWFYNYAAKEDEGHYEGSDVMMNIVAVLLVAFTMLILLLGFKKKPVGIMIFDVLLLGAYSFENFVHVQLEVVPYNYTWSLAYYLFFVAIAVVFVGAIWLIVDKAKSKKAETAAVQESGL